MEQFAAARELQRRGLKLSSLGLRQTDLPHPCRTALASLGVVTRRHSAKDRDWIAEILSELYGCDGSSIWRDLLGSEYEHGLQMLVEAKARFPGAYSEWLSLQDGFSDIALRQFMAFLELKGLAGHQRTVGGDGKLIDYGVLLAATGPFDRAYTAVATALRRVHERRNRLPGSHPYEKRGGARNKWLVKRERDALAIEIRASMDGIAAEFALKH